MPDLSPSERLQPCLLARLTDNERSSQQESRDKRVLTMSQYRQSVLEDLRWLFNTKASDIPELEEFDAASRSTLNYGMPDFCGITSSNMDLGELERRTREAILNFEPRILREGLEVSVSVDSENYGTDCLMFEIRGVLWAQPMPETLYVTSVIDLDSGQSTVKESAGG